MARDTGDLGPCAELCLHGLSEAAVLGLAYLLPNLFPTPLPAWVTRPGSPKFFVTRDVCLSVIEG